MYTVPAVEPYWEPSAEIPRLSPDKVTESPKRQSVHASEADSVATELNVPPDEVNTSASPASLVEPTVAYGNVSTKVLPFEESAMALGSLDVVNVWPRVHVPLTRL